MNKQSITFSLVLGCLISAATLNVFGQQSNTHSVTFPLKASANNRYLVDQKNKPFPILGRTSWFMISQSEADYQFYLDNTLAKGFNSIEMSMITHDPRGSHPPFNGDGDLPFLKQLDGSPWKGTKFNKKFTGKSCPGSTTGSFIPPATGSASSDRFPEFLQ